MLITCKPKEKAHAGLLVIGQEKFTDVLVEVQLLEAAYTIHFQRSDTSRVRMNEYYAQVFEKFQITNEEFTESLKWYAVHPELMQEVYEDVGEKLSKKKADIK